MPGRQGRKSGQRHADPALTCNGSAAQSWILGKDGTFRAFGKCLDNARNASTNGDKISAQEIAYHWLAQPVLMVLVDCCARSTVAGSEV